jgi:hypothetical protein
VCNCASARPYQVSFGAGYSTNTGARVEAAYRSSDFLGRAWELHTGVRLEQLRQTAYADVFFPPDEKQRRDGVGTAVEHSDIENLGISRFAVGATRLQQRGSIEQRLGINWQEEQQSPQGAPSTTARALTAQLGWTWRHARDPLDPAEGISLQLQLGGGSKALLSDQDFFRTYLRYSQGIPLGASDALLFRGELGVTLAPSSQGIPQDFLFRAGGSNSVRGYAYQSLGVKEGSAIVGGRYLATMSGEYTHWITRPGARRSLSMPATRSMIARRSISRSVMASARAGEVRPDRSASTSPMASARASCGSISRWRSRFDCRRSAAMSQETTAAAPPASPPPAAWASTHSRRRGHRRSGALVLAAWLSACAPRWRCWPECRLAARQRGWFAHLLPDDRRRWPAGQLTSDAEPAGTLRGPLSLQSAALAG